MGDETQGGRRKYYKITALDKNMYEFNKKIGNLQKIIEWIKRRGKF